MVFVHGFNNRFDDAIYRYAQFVHDGRFPVIPVLYSWPSQGAPNLGSYEYDRKVAVQSGASLIQLVDLVNANPSIKEITFVCHSMGCLSDPCSGASREGSTRRRVEAEERGARRARHLL